MQALMSRERREAVGRALEALGPDDRRLLGLMYGEGLDAAEAARLLEVSPEAVRVRKHRALRRLAEALGADGNDPLAAGTIR